ncbi:MAG: rhizopine-binding protein, partial [Amaricoccus sp.]
MKTLLAGVALSALLAQGAMAATVAVSMARFDDNFLTVLRNGLDAYSKTLDGVNVQIEDAGNDVA